MSLRVKIVTILIVGAGCMLLGNGLLERFIVLPRFLALEQDAVQQNLRRVERALSQETEELKTLARSYGVWDDACRFIETRNPDFVQSNLSDESLSGLRVDFVRFCGNDGKVRWEKIGARRVAGGGEAEPMARLPGTEAILPNRESSARGGLWPVQGGWMLLAVQPILNSRGEGPPRGILVFGRSLGAGDQKRLAGLTSVDFQLLPAETAPGGELAPWLAPEARIDQRAGQVVAYAPLMGLAGSRIGWLQVDTPRDIATAGRDAVELENRMMLLVATVMVLSTYFGFGRLVLRPIHGLIAHVLWIRQSGDLDRRVQSQGSDEVGVLGREFDLLLAQLARAHARRVRSERHLRAALEQQRDLAKNDSDAARLESV